MPELNREDIIKAMEGWLKTFNGDVERFMLIANALTLIKQLTEDNERLKEKADRHLDNLKAVLDERAEQEVASRIIGHLVSKKNELCQVEYHQKEIDDYFLRALEFWDYIDDFVGLTGEEILAYLKKKYIGEKGE
jgi:hypothetical protein